MGRAGLSLSDGILDFRSVFGSCPIVAGTYSQSGAGKLYQGIYIGMRKFLILLGVLVILVLGAVWWLGGQAEKGKPEPGEVRIEVDDVL